MAAELVDAARFTMIKLSQSADGVGRLTLARQAQRNAINGLMAAEVAEAVSLLAASGTRVGVIDAEGPAFCAGADLRDLDNAGAAIDSIVESLTSEPIHWTAVVAGAARGGALSILAACPRVYATSAASFGLPELARGFFPAGVIGTQVALLGTRRAFELAFRAGAVDAAEAKALGLITDVIEEAELESRLEAESALLLGHDADGLREGVHLWNARARTASSA
jgi:enoyl-CoA hydratase/carnithine racemase